MVPIRLQGVTHGITVDVWRWDARGKIMSWDPECRKEYIDIMKRMDEAAVKLITAANAIMLKENEPSVPNGMIGLSRIAGHTFFRYRWDQ